MTRPPPRNRKSCELVAQEPQAAALLDHVGQVERDAAGDEQHRRALHALRDGEAHGVPRGAQVAQDAAALDLDGHVILEAVAQGVRVAAHGERVAEDAAAEALREGVAHEGGAVAGARVDAVVAEALRGGAAHEVRAVPLEVRVLAEERVGAAVAGALHAGVVREARAVLREGAAREVLGRYMRTNGVGSSATSDSKTSNCTRTSNSNW